MASLTSEPPSTSVSLIERVRGREPAAWNRLSAIYGPLVYRWCRRAGLQEADAADVLQEVFRALLTGIADFRPGAASGGFRGWLYGIARHKLADHFRRKARDAAGGEMAGHEPLAPLPDSSTDESADDAALVLHAALEQIRPDFDEHNWQAFYRTTIERQAAVDVAAQLGLTPGAVRQGKFRILRRLRQELDGLH